jgi:hypothetical protein
MLRRDIHHLIQVMHTWTIIGDFEACIRDSHLAPREIAGIVAALKSGIPAQLPHFQASGLGADGISNYAARLAEERGLDAQLAQFAQGVSLRASGQSVGARASPAP